MSLPADLKTKRPNVASASERLMIPKTRKVRGSPCVLTLSNGGGAAVIKSRLFKQWLRRDLALCVSHECGGCYVGIR